MQTPDDALAARPVCFGPGSDIANAHPDLLIATVNNTHLLVINKYCVFRPQLLLLTVDSFRRQHEPLCLDDLEAAWTALEAMDSPHFAMFNCTPTAGASRAHKHMHIIPRPGSHSGEDGGFHLFLDCKSPGQKDASFRYFHWDLQDSHLEKPISSKTLLEIYLDLLTQARCALDIPDDGPQSICPHNVILVKEWIVVVPRRTNNFKSVTANGAGMMGSVWLVNDGQLDRWKELGLRNVLSHLGVPAQEGEHAEPI